MNTVEYLNETKKKLGITSDYALAKALGITKQQVSNYQRLHVKPDEYACTRIAVALGADPAKVIAEIAVEWEKNEKKREFWLNFLSRAASQTVITVGLICTSLWWHAPNLNAMTMTSDILKEKLVTYQPIMRSIRAYIIKLYSSAVRPIGLKLSVTVTQL